MEPSTDPSQSCPESHTIPLPWPGFLLPGPSEWWKGKCGLKLGAPAWAPSPWGVPLGNLGDHSPHCRRAALSQGCRVSLLFFVMQHPRGDWEVCWCYMLLPSMGNVIAALTLLTRCWESVKHKWQGERRKTEKEKWRVAWLLQVSPVIKSVYSLHMNLSSHNCQL